MPRDPTKPVEPQPPEQPTPQDPVQRDPLPDPTTSPDQGADQQFQLDQAQNNLVLNKRSLTSYNNN